jgi:polyketide cyclase/dehydrase/lipid transport protein
MRWLLLIAGVMVAIVLIVALIGLMLPGAHRAMHMASFGQPPEAIFAAITGPQDWRGIVKTDLPAEGGRRRWREQSGRRSITFEETASDRPRLYQCRIADADLPFSGTWTWEITATKDGCICRITEEGQIKSPVFRFVSRFILGQTRTIDDYLSALGRKFGEPVKIVQ